MRLRLTFALGTLLLSGCAYLTNYTRSIDLKDSSYAVDIKQRIVFSQKRADLPSTLDGVHGDSKASGQDYVVVCAEPSPDALTAIGVSGGLSLSANQIDTTGNLGGALAEQSAFVGLRTTSIQLLRDAMYRLCEGYAAGAVSRQTFQSLQRRYQSTMMGLIAIEQLTKPIVASQVALTTAAASQAGAGAGDSAVDKAQGRVESTTEKQVAAQKTADEKQVAFEDARKKVSGATTNLRAAQAKKDAAAESEAKSALETARSEEAQAKIDRDAAKNSLSATQDASKAARQALRDAQTKVNASASGSAQLGDTAGAIAASNEQIKDGVVAIVKEINLSYLRDACFYFSTDVLRDKDQIEMLTKFKTTDPESTFSPAIMIRSVLAACSDILYNETARLTGKSVPELRSQGKEAQANLDKDVKPK